jgi:hypothetical protein
MLSCIVFVDVRRKGMRCVMRSATELKAKLLLQVSYVLTASESACLHLYCGETSAFSIFLCDSGVGAGPEE